MGGLLVAVDALVSLHRGEGLGLNIADALALAVPVIATDAGGSRDLCNPEHVWLVPAVPAPVPGGCEPYDVGSMWFEPDLDAAVDHFRHIAGHRPEATRRAVAARRWVLDAYSPAACGAVVAERLRAIGS
jgi:glycosyltransferase involved in cell wall biosynthesis